MQDIYTLIATAAAWLSRSAAQSGSVIVIEQCKDKKGYRNGRVFLACLREATDDESLLDFVPIVME